MSPIKSADTADAQGLLGGDPGRPEVVIDLALVEMVRWMAQPAVRAFVADGSPTFTMAEATLMQRVAAEGPVRMSRLADWQGLDRSTVTTQVASLERRDLLARSPDPSDGRAVLVAVTPAARRALAHARDQVQRLVRGAMAGWPEEERARLAGSLARLVDGMGRIDVPAARNDGSPRP